MSALHFNVDIQHMKEMFSNACILKSILIWSAAVDNKRLRYKLILKTYLMNQRHESRLPTPRSSRLSIDAPYVQTNGK